MSIIPNPRPLTADNRVLTTYTWSAIDLDVEGPCPADLALLVSIHGMPDRVTLRRLGADYAEYHRGE